MPHIRSHITDWNNFDTIHSIEVNCVYIVELLVLSCDSSKHDDEMVKRIIAETWIEYVGRDIPRNPCIVIYSCNRIVYLYKYCIVDL